MSLRELYISVTNPTSPVYLPESAKTAEEGWPTGIKNPKCLYYSYKIPVSVTMILSIGWFYQFILCHLIPCM